MAPYEEIMKYGEQFREADGRLISLRPDEVRM